MKKKLLWLALFIIWCFSIGGVYCLFDEHHILFGVLTIFTIIMAVPFIVKQFKQWIK